MTNLLIYVIGGILLIIVVLLIVLLMSKGKGGKLIKSDKTLARSIDKEIKKKNSGYNENALLAFLDEADEAYTEFYLRKNVTWFKKYAASDLVTKMVRQLRMKRTEIGDPAYRKIIWNLVNTAGDTVCVKKSTIFTKTTLMGDTPIKVGDDTYEWWTIAVEGNRFSVLDILGG